MAAGLNYLISDVFKGSSLNALPVVAFFLLILIIATFWFLPHNLGQKQLLQDISTLNNNQNPQILPANKSLDPQIARNFQSNTSKQFNNGFKKNDFQIQVEPFQSERYCNIKPESTRRQPHSLILNNQSPSITQKEDYPLQDLFFGKNNNCKNKITTNTKDQGLSVPCDNIIGIQPQKQSIRATPFSIWRLPKVALFIFINSFTKSTNALMVGWLIFEIGLKGIQGSGKLLFIIWSISVFSGGYFGARINREMKKSIFILMLTLAGICFISVQQIGYTQMWLFASTLCFTGNIFGGTYNLFSTAIPIFLCENKQIKQIRGAQTMIIAVMESVALLMCGFAVLILPFIGITLLFYVAAGFCLIAASILATTIFKEYFQEKNNLSTKSI